MNNSWGNKKRGCVIKPALRCNPCLIYTLGKILMIHPLFLMIISFEFIPFLPIPSAIG